MICAQLAHVKQSPRRNRFSIVTERVEIIAAFFHAVDIYAVIIVIVIIIIIIITKQ